MTTQNTETVNQAANEAANEVAVIENNETALVIEDLPTDLNPSMFDNVSTALWSSIESKDRKSAIKVFNAINNSEHALADNLGAVLEIQDMLAHPITLQDEITKQDVQAMRVVLVTKEGKAYHAISQGVVSSLQKIISIVGPAPWLPGLKITPVEVKTRKGFKTLTLHLSE